MSNSWRIVFDYVLLCVWLPLMLCTYALWYRSRNSEVMRVRQPAIVMLNGLCNVFMMVVVVTQDLVLLKGGGDFPCLMLMIASLQAMPLSTFLGGINTWLLVYSFHPELRKHHFERFPAWKFMLSRPRNYFAAAGLGWVMMSIPFAVFYTHYERWRPSMQERLPGEFGVCFMAHEYWFYTPVTILLVAVMAASRPHVRDISDYFSLGNEARIATYMGVWTLTYHVLNISAQAGAWDRPRWDRDVIPLNFLPLVAPVIITFKVAYTIYLGKGATLVALTRQQAALHHAAHKARMVAALAEGAHHASQSSITDTSLLRQMSSSSSSLRDSDGDLEFGKYEGGAGGGHAPHLAAILADATLREMMLLHARRALCPENIIFVQRMVELRETAGPQLSALQTQLKEAQQLQRARARAAMPMASPKAGGHRSLPSQLSLSPLRSQPSDGALFTPSTPQSEPVVLSESEQLALVQRSLPLLAVLRSDFVAAGSTYELNLSMDLRRTWIKQLAALEQWANQQAAGETPVDPPAPAVVAPPASLSSTPSTLALSLSPLSSFLLTLDLVESEVLLLTETNLYHSFLDCTEYRAHARLVKHQARKAERALVAAGNVHVATTVMSVSSPDTQPLPTPRMLTGGGLTVGAGAGASVGPGGVSPNPSQFRSTWDGASPSPAASAPTSPTFVKLNRNVAHQNISAASLVLDAQQPSTTQATATAPTDEPTPILPGQASLQ